MVRPRGPEPALFDGDVIGAPDAILGQNARDPVFGSPDEPASSVSNSPEA